MIPKYKEKLWKCFSERRVQDHMKELETMSAEEIDPDSLRKLDDDITRSMRAAEKFEGAKIRILPRSNELQL